MHSSDLFDDDMVEPALKNYTQSGKTVGKIPWVDKYRPRQLNEIVQQTEVIKVLKESLKTGTFPHMLFYGPPGTGKTSSILAFAMELFGPKVFPKRVIELNASDERGIGIVRNKIIGFAKTAIGNPDPDYPCPPFKIIILDEADAMTMEAQSALRTVMETLSGVTRFCFICNYINQIIDPIASRCMKFRYKPIDNLTMSSKLQLIAKKEDFPIGQDIIELILELAKGDIRSGIITLQYMKYIYDYQGLITVQDIYDTTNYLPDPVLKTLWDDCIVNEKASITKLKDRITEIKQKGYSTSAIINKFTKLVISSKELNGKQKGVIGLLLANTERRLIDGADEFIQLFNIVAYTQGVYRNKIKY